MTGWSGVVFQLCLAVAKRYFNALNYLLEAAIDGSRRQKSGGWGSRARDGEHRV